MEGNRDEAEKCVEIAREALNAGNREKAQRFLQKAEKLYPLPSARGEALALPFLPARPPGRRAARSRPHPRPSGSQRGSRPARPRGGAPGSSIPTHPRPGPDCPRPSPPWAAPPRAARDALLTCLRDARSPPTRRSCRFPGRFSYCPAVILPGDSPGCVFAEWGFLSGCLVVWRPPFSSSPPSKA